MKAVKGYFMDIDFTPFFERYENLREQADAVFKKVQQQHPDCVNCKVECADCCHALFDLTLIEALYINHRFKEQLPEKRRSELLDVANKTDRVIYKLKRKAFKALETGESEEKIITNLAAERVACPLLNSENCCELYDQRPITCRLYGIPTSIDGKGHTCGLSNFKPGESYPTVNLDLIQSKLYEISKDLVEKIRSKYIKMGEMLVPLSMALLTTYDATYLGLPNNNEEDSSKGNQNE